MPLINTSNLSGAALDWAVVKAIGKACTFEPYIQWLGTTNVKIVGYGVYLDPSVHDEFGRVAFSPASDWEQGGTIIEKEGIALWLSTTPELGRWAAADERWMKLDPDSDEFMELPDPWHGDTALVAAMRCVVASKLGDEVDIPEELLEKA